VFLPGTLGLITAETTGEYRSKDLPGGIVDSFNVGT
jgi:hypothetical protein